MALSTRQAAKAARTAQAQRIAQAQAETAAVVRSGRCPFCGAGLRRNNAILGWWQCQQLGAEGFRKDASQPSCNWQGFVC